MNARVFLEAGAAPSTAGTIRFTPNAENMGADAALIVSPYHHKPSDRELSIVKQHLMPCAPAITVDIILTQVKELSIITKDSDTGKKPMTQLPTSRI